MNISKESIPYDLEYRFWGKVDKSGDCWIWIAGKRGGRYGGFWNGKKQVAAHRFVYELAYGVDPSRLDVLHECDNPLCVNPDHLFLGTHTDNMRDASKKGRLNTSRNQGFRSHFAKLDENDVIEIRRLAKSGILQEELSRQYRISQPTVSMIINRKTWRHV